MPDLARIKSLSDGFEQVNVKYFGAVSFIMPIVSKLFSSGKAKNFSDYMDNFVGCKKSAFKFVLFCEKLNK